MGLLKIAGADANQFLQGQITCDLNELQSNQTVTGAYCDRKGRVLSNFHVILHEDTYWLLMPNAMLTATHDALKKYALMSKVSINIDRDLALIGMTAPPTTTPGGVLFTALIPNNRHIIAVPTLQLQALWEILTRSHPPIGHATWAYGDILARLAYVQPATSLRFLPQMLGLNQFNAVSFNKGCYLGQEIIARAEHRGKVKKTLQVINIKQRINVGESIPEIPANTVINCTETPSGWQTLVVMQSP